MIYLIQITYYNETENIPIKLLKIGYTKDENKDIRYSQYKMHNPLFMKFLMRQKNKREIIA